MWDQRYSEQGFAYGTVANDFIKDQYSHIPKGGKVLCLAEGEGRNAVFLALQGYQVTAIDLSEVGLAKAQQLAEQHGVKISTQVADLADYHFAEQVWDGIVSISAHMPSALRKQVHAQIGHSLKKDGVFILEAYTRQHLELEGRGGPPASQTDLFMSLAELKIELADLELVSGTETQRHICEGKYHQGQSAVVQFIARKK